MSSNQTNFPHLALVAAAATLVGLWILLMADALGSAGSL